MIGFRNEARSICSNSGSTWLESIELMKVLLTGNIPYIGIGQTHCLANPVKVPLEITALQSGADLVENDIVRFEDSYGRGNSKCEQP